MIATYTTPYKNRSHFGSRCGSVPTVFYLVAEPCRQLSPPNAIEDAAGTSATKQPAKDGAADSVVELLPAPTVLVRGTACGAAEKSMAYVQWWLHERHPAIHKALRAGRRGRCCTCSVCVCVCMGVQVSQ